MTTPDAAKMRVAIDAIVSLCEHPETYSRPALLSALMVLIEQTEDDMVACFVKLAKRHAGQMHQTMQQSNDRITRFRPDTGSILPLSWRAAESAPPETFLLVASILQIAEALYHVRDEIEDLIGQAVLSKEK